MTRCTRWASTWRRSSQTERYVAGHYRDAVLKAVAERDAIEAVLARHRTKDAAPVVESEQEAEALAESVASDDDEPVGTGDLARFPYKPYCRDCGRDTVTLTSYDDETTELAYTCDYYGYSGVTNLATEFEGKLVWKVDWPMRWALEHVDFEPAGMDHATPGSSFTVGHDAGRGRSSGCRGRRGSATAFVGFAGMQKMSSSAGGAPTASDALQVLEAPILRWLYVRRNRARRSTSTSGPRWSGCTTSGTRSAARPLDPRVGTPRCWPGSGPPPRRRPASADPVGAGAVPAALLGRRRDGRLAPS